MLLLLLLLLLFCLLRKEVSGFQFGARHAELSTSITPTAEQSIVHDYIVSLH